MESMRAKRIMGLSLARERGINERNPPEKMSYKEQQEARRRETVLIGFVRLLPTGSSVNENLPQYIYLEVEVGQIGIFGYPQELCDLLNHILGMKRSCNCLVEDQYDGKRIDISETHFMSRVRHPDLRSE